MSLNTARKILVMHSRLSGYFLACLTEFQAKTNSEIHVIRKIADKLAPFKFPETTAITFYDRNSLDNDGMVALAKQLQPDAILMSGWADSGYKKVAKIMKKQGCMVIMGMDNQWRGTLKQRIASLLSPFLVKPYITHIWVPGRFQYEYARRLGIQSTQILLRYYSADTPAFDAGNAPINPAKRFIFVGRLVEEKGIHELAKLIQRFWDEGIKDWQFDFIGSGPLSNQIPDLPTVHHQEFLQPSELAKERETGGIFILPSRFEPWGVVVHEFSVAGFPLLLSSSVGAIDGFLNEGWNGFSFKAGDENELYHAAKRFCDIDPETRVKMGQRSIQMGNSITPGAWASTLIETIRSWSDKS